MIDGLAYFPKEDVIEGMAFVKENCFTEPEDQIVYFDCNYVNGTFYRIKVPGSMDMKLKKISPLFSQGTRNVHSITLDGVIGLTMFVKHGIVPFRSL